MIKSLNETSRLLIYISGAFSLVIALLGAFVLNDGGSYATGYTYLTLVGERASFPPGVLAGYALAAAKTAMIDRSCKKALEMDVPQAKAYASAAYFSRFLLTGAVFFVSINSAAISFLGVVFGAFSLQLAGYVLPLAVKRSGCDGF